MTEHRTTQLERSLRVATAYVAAAVNEGALRDNAVPGSMMLERLHAIAYGQSDAFIDLAITDALARDDRMESLIRACHAILRARDDQDYPDAFDRSFRTACTLAEQALRGL